MNAKLVFEPEAGLSRLLLQNAFLNLLTLRLYRFWAITDQRRHLWSSLRIGGDAAEYSGRVNELLRGFVTAFFILSPIYVLICALREILRYDAMLLAIFANTTFFGAIALFAIGQYQNRRYILSHTVWRGIRAGQGGSSLVYAARYCLWAFTFCITAGLSVPWACEDLARYRTRHSFWGNYLGNFEGRARQIFLPWLIVTARVQLKWEPKVVVMRNYNDQAVALGAGLVVMSSGFLFDIDDQAEFAAVLAHEIGHNELRSQSLDLAEVSSLLGLADVFFDSTIGRWGALLVGRGNYVPSSAREGEREADRYAVERLREAGIDGSVYAESLRLRGDSKPSIFSTHPPRSERARIFQAAAQPGSTVLTPQEWRALKSICRTTTKTAPVSPPEPS